VLRRDEAEKLGLALTLVCLATNDGHNATAIQFSIAAERSIATKCMRKPKSARRTSIWCRYDDYPVIKRHADRGSWLLQEKRRPGLRSPTQFTADGLVSFTRRADIVGRPSGAAGGFLGLVEIIRRSPDNHLAPSWPRRALVWRAARYINYDRGLVQRRRILASGAMTR